MWVERSTGCCLDACPTLPEIRTVATSIDEILEQVKNTAIDQQGLASDRYDTLLWAGDYQYYLQLKEELEQKLTESFHFL